MDRKSVTEHVIIAIYIHILLILEPTLVRKSWKKISPFMLITSYNKLGCEDQLDPELIKFRDINVWFLTLQTEMNFSFFFFLKNGRTIGKLIDPKNPGKLKQVL